MQQVLYDEHRKQSILLCCIRNIILRNENFSFGQYRQMKNLDDHSMSTATAERRKLSRRNVPQRL